MRITVALAVACAIVGLARAQESSAALKQYDLNIPRQPLDLALKDLAKQTGLQIARLSEAADGNAVVGPVSGSLTAGEALQSLLKEQGLTFEVVDGKTIAIVNPSSEAAHAVDDMSMRLSPSANQSHASSDNRGMRLARAAQADPQSPAPRSKSDDVQEIVVTAQKREERLQDVPISMSVLSGDELDRSTDKGVVEALNRVPGVMSLVSSTGARSNYVDAIVVRGVAPGVGSATTAYYLDTIPFGFIARAFAPDSSAYDLERVEVLRGPQGTLYGASALNGVVRVLTKDANLDKFEFKGRASTSTVEDGAASYRGDMALNVPLIEGKVAARAVVGYQKLGGWIDKPFENDVNDGEVGNYRFKINARPTEQLSLGMFAWLSRSNYGAPASSADGRESLSLYPEPSSIDFDAYGLKAVYDFSGGVTITSMTSHIDHTQVADVDFAPFVPDTFFHQDNESKVFSQEILVSSDQSGQWRWSFGGFYRDARESYYSTLYDPRTGALTSGFLAPLRSNTFSESFAVFGEVTRLFFDRKLEVTAGLRYFEDEISDREKSRFTVVGGVPATGLASSDNNFDNVAPRLSLNWHPSDTTTIYANYGEGFRSGLNQGPAVREAAPQFPPADPDTLRNYEVGAKGSLWDGRVSFDAAVFYIDWSNVQQVLGVRVGNVLTGAIVNGESASGPGYEIGATLHAAEGLTLSANFSRNDLTFDHDVISFGTVLFSEGSRLLNSPEYTIGGAVGYAFPISGGFNGSVAASANYLPSIRNSTITDTESLLFTRASFTVDAASGWAASVFVDSLNDEDGLVGNDPFSIRWDTRPRPRTIGVQFDFGF